MGVVGEEVLDLAQVKEAEVVPKVTDPGRRAQREKAIRLPTKRKGINATLVSG